MPEETNPRLLRTIRQDMGRVGTEVRRTGLKGTVGRALEDLREFYLTTEDLARLARMGRARRAIYFTWWLLKSLFLKLTPARRILLLLAFVALAQGSGVIASSDRFRVSVDVGWMGVVLILLVLALELKDKLLAREELEAGRAVQMALMPPPAPVLPGWQIWLFTRPANDVGGDLVDYLRIGEHRASIVLGDVAGKGLPAALLMAKLQATLRALAPEFTSLAEIGSRVNTILHRDGLPNRFATLVYLEVAPTAGRVRILNAGHMPPLVVRCVRRRPSCRAARSRSACWPTRTSRNSAVDLLDGDTLVVYSDGVTEAMNAAGEFFGDDRLRGAAAVGGRAVGGDCRRDDCRRRGRVRGSCKAPRRPVHRRASPPAVNKYAAAKSSRDTLLYVGRDFSKTDIKSARLPGSRTWVGHVDLQAKRRLSPRRLPIQIEGRTTRTDRSPRFPCQATLPRSILARSYAHQGVPSDERIHSTRGTCRRGRRDRLRGSHRPDEAAADRCRLRQVGDARAGREPRRALAGRPLARLRRQPLQPRQRAGDRNLADGTKKVVPFGTQPVFSSDSKWIAYSHRRSPRRSRRSSGASRSPSRTSWAC